MSGLGTVGPWALSHRDEVSWREAGYWLLWVAAAMAALATGFAFLGERLGLSPVSVRAGVVVLLTLPMTLLVLVGAMLGSGGVPTPLLVLAIAVACAAAGFLASDVWLRPERYAGGLTWTPIPVAMVGVVFQVGYLAWAELTYK